MLNSFLAYNNKVTFFPLWVFGSLPETFADNTNKYIVLIIESCLDSNIKVSWQCTDTLILCKSVNNHVISYVYCVDTTHDARRFEIITKLYSSVYTCNKEM